MDTLVPATPLTEMDPEEKRLVHELKERVQDLTIFPGQKDDNYLIKWLIARRFDLDKAEDMFRKHIRFIKLNGLDDLAKGYTPPEVVDYFYTARLGYDKDGSVVRILNIGASDLRGLCLSLSKIDCVKYASYILAKDAIVQQEERANLTRCDKQVYILDLKDLSWRTIVQRIVVDRAYMLLRSYEANHPESLKVAYLINAPNFFSFIYSWLKTVLPESIISKLEVLSQDECASVLTKYIDPAILPASIGGMRRDPDGNPSCQSLYVKPLGTPVPEELIPTNHMEILKNDPDAKKIIVDYKSSFIVEKEVLEPNSILQWDFQTVDYDIRMGLRYKPEDNAEPEVIIPAHRADSHIIPESGRFACEKSGIYEIVFDNTYSWMTRKEVTFKICLLPPDNGKDVEN